jgi:hypothetical protein
VSPCAKYVPLQPLSLHTDSKQHENSSQRMCFDYATRRLHHRHAPFIRRDQGRRATRICCVCTAGQVRHAPIEHASFGRVAWVHYTNTAMRNLMYSWLHMGCGAIQSISACKHFMLVYIILMPAVDSCFRYEPNVTDRASRTELGCVELLLAAARSSGGLRTAAST